MEKYENQINELLFKFSHANVILGYYGGVDQVQLLMNSLCRKSRKEYKKNKFAYEVSIKSQKSELEYVRSFDKDISDYLTKEGIYKEYFLKIIVKSKESLEILNNFLLGITSPKKLRFSKIDIQFYCYNESEYNDLISNLTRLKIDLSCVNTTLPVYASSIQMLESILKSVKRIEWKCFTPYTDDYSHPSFEGSNTNVIRGFTFTSIPYSNILLTLQRTETKNVFKRMKLNIFEISLSDYTKDSNLNKYQFNINSKFYSMNLRLILRFYERIKEQNLNIELTNIKLGYENSNFSYFVKSPCNILFKKENKFFLISADKGILRYKDRINLLNGNQTKNRRFAANYQTVSDEILLFKDFEQIELLGIKQPATSGNLFDTYMGHYMKLNEEIKKHENLYIVLNKSFDEMSLAYFERDYIPCLISKIIKIKLKYNQKNSMFRRIMNYMDKIPQTTEVWLKIEFYQWHNSLFRETIMKIIKSTRVVHLHLYGVGITKTDILYKLFGLEKKTEKNGKTTFTNSTFYLNQLKQFIFEYEVEDKKVQIYNLNAERINYLKNWIKTVKFDKYQVHPDIDSNFTDFIRFN